MSNEDLGLWITAGALALCIAIGMVVTYLYPIEWFRARLLSGDRWIAVQGMLPIAFPVYLIAGTLFSYFRH